MRDPFWTALTAEVNRATEEGRAGTGTEAGPTSWPREEEEEDYPAEGRAFTVALGAVTVELVSTGTGVGVRGAVLLLAGSHLGGIVRITRERVCVAVRCQPCGGTGGPYPEPFTCTACGGTGEAERVAAPIAATIVYGTAPGVAR